MTPLKLLYFDELDSTNELAKRECDNLENFTIIIADYQYKGKGRNNREWYSPKGENIYCSIILKDNIPAKFLSGIPIITGFSILKTIENILNKEIYIKWPNDLIVNNKKICGILTEYYKKNIIIGIGLNVNSNKFPDFDFNEPTSICIETGEKVDRLILLKEFFKNFRKIYENYVREKKIPDDILFKINAKLYLKGEEVVVEFCNKTEKGKVIQILQNGALKLSTGIIYAGDVKKIRKLKL